MDDGFESLQLTNSSMKLGLLIGSSAGENMHSEAEGFINGVIDRRRYAFFAPIFSAFTAATMASPLWPLPDVRQLLSRKFKNTYTRK